MLIPPVQVGYLHWINTIVVEICIVIYIINKLPDSVTYLVIVTITIYQVIE